MTSYIVVVPPSIASGTAVSPLPAVLLGDFDLAGDPGVPFPVSVACVPSFSGGSPETVLETSRGFLSTGLCGTLARRGAFGAAPVFVVLDDPSGPVFDVVEAAEGGGAGRV